MFVLALLLGVTPLVGDSHVESAVLPAFLPSMREFLEVSAGTEIAFRSRSLDFGDHASGADRDVTSVQNLKEVVATMHFGWEGLRYREVVQEVIEGELQAPRTRYGLHSYLDGMASSADHSYGSGTTWTQSAPWRSLPKAAWLLSGRYPPLGQEASLLWVQPVADEAWQYEARFFLPRKQSYADLFFDADPVRLRKVEIRDSDERIARRVDYGAAIGGVAEDVVARPAMAIESLFREDGTCRSARAWLRLESGHLTTGPKGILSGTVALLDPQDGQVEAGIVRTRLDFDELPGWIESQRRQERLDELRSTAAAPAPKEGPAAPAVPAPSSNWFDSHLGSGVLLVALGLVLLIRK